MKLKSCFILCLLAMPILAVAACKNGLKPMETKGVTDTTSTQIDTGNKSTTNAKTDTDIYVVGTVKAMNEYEFDAAAYWKNGVLTIVSDTTKDCEATGIAVNGGNVYIAGYYNNNNDTNPTSTAAYWVNTHATEKLLTANKANQYSNGIGVNANGVYIVGTCDRNAVYWQNGNRTAKLLAATADNSQANAVYANGQDVYMAGSINGSAAYWKNGTLVHQQPHTSNSTAIAFDGANIYTAGMTVGTSNDGTVTDTVTYWKNNGKAMYIASSSRSDANINATAVNAIAVNNGNIYMAGFTTDTNHNHVAAYWKNGTYTPFTGGYELNGIAVVGNDVYVTGQFITGKNTAYWKNGIIKTLPRANKTTGIVIITHPH